MHHGVVSSRSCSSIVPRPDDAGLGDGKSVVACSDFLSRGVEGAAVSVFIGPVVDEKDDSDDVFLISRRLKARLRLSSSEYGAW